VIVRSAAQAITLEAMTKRARHPVGSRRALVRIVGLNLLDRAARLSECAAV